VLALFKAVSFIKEAVFNALLFIEEPKVKLGFTLFQFDVIVGVVIAEHAGHLANLSYS